MPKIRLLRPWMAQKAGSEIDVSPAEAGLLVASKTAEFVAAAPETKDIQAPPERKDVQGASRKARRS